MSSHSNEPPPALISVFSDQRRTKSTTWSRVSCGTQTPVRVPQCLFLGRRAPPSTQPEPRPWSGSSSTDMQSAPDRRNGWSAASARRQQPHSRRIPSASGRKPSAGVPLHRTTSRGLFLQQMPPQDGDLLLRRVLLALLLHAFSPLPYWENAFSISR